MAQFPSSIVSITNPTSSNTLNSPSHSTQHATENNEIIALETKVGVDGSAVTTSLDYLIKNASSGGGGHVQAANVGGTGQTSYTKGDTLVASSSSVLGKVAVGTDGYVFTADSTQTNGVNWTAASFIPGQILMYGISTAPSGWLSCDGTAVSRTTYATLWGVIGSVWGGGNGSTTFNVPDLRGRVPMGAGTGAGGGISGVGSVAGGSVLSARAIAAWTGEETHLLAGSESGLPSHTHTFASSDTQAAGGQIAKGNASSSIFATSATGGTDAAAAHNTMQPSITISFIIKT